MSAHEPRVALVSIGLGRVQRGFERYFADLFAVLRDEIPMTLYRSAGGDRVHERVPRGLGTLTAMARRLPFGRWMGRAEYQRDCIAFGAALIPDLLREPFDVVHCIDPPLAHVLQRLKRWTGFTANVLFTEGCVMPPALYPRVNHIHHVGWRAFEAARAAGIPDAAMTLVPCGLHARRFARRPDREAIRARYGIAESTFVVLAVSAVKRDHKRVDHLIEEAAQLDGDVLLWIDGNPEDASVPHLARARLGTRCRITHVRSDMLPDLYTAADVLVHASLSESFGLAIVEALSAELPVLVHQDPHFEWLVGDRDCLVDMSTPGCLVARLQDHRSHPERLRRGSAIRAERIRQRFDWTAVAPAYADMYRRVAMSSRRADARSFAERSPSEAS
jgi:glycosyltransferase involved in cell wall biosynthesis